MEPEARTFSIETSACLLRGIPGRHSAIQYALFHPATARMRIVSAGMPGPILLRGEDSRVLQIAGLPPGLFSAAKPMMNSRCSWKPGDSLLFFHRWASATARNLHDQEFRCGRRPGHLAAGVPANRPSIFWVIFFSTIQEFTANCKQVGRHEPQLTSTSRDNRGEHFSTVVNWAKLCLFSFGPPDTSPVTSVVTVLFVFRSPR